MELQCGSYRLSPQPFFQGDLHRALTSQSTPLVGVGGSLLRVGFSYTLKQLSVSCLNIIIVV